MGGINTTAAGGGQKQGAGSPSDSDQDDYTKLYMQEKSSRNIVEDEQAIHYTTDSTRCASSGSTSGRHVPYVFKWYGDGEEVYVTGSWDGWKQKQQLHKEKNDEEHFTVVELPEGEHEYRFWVDGVWEHYGDLPKRKTTSGCTNNIITVLRTDFEVMTALESDEKSSASRFNTWSQHAPPLLDGERFPPPTLPAALQLHIVNETPRPLEPVLLSQPNHIMLNHLYALAKKDGVLVFCNTQRYREKYVSTLIYKPV